MNDFNNYYKISNKKIRNIFIINNYKEAIYYNKVR